MVSVCVYGPVLFHFCPSCPQFMQGFGMAKKTGLLCVMDGFLVSSSPCDVL